MNQPLRTVYLKYGLEENYGGGITHHHIVSSILCYHINYDLGQHRTIWEMKEKINMERFGSYSSQLLKHIVTEAHN